MAELKTKRTCSGGFTPHPDLMEKLGKYKTGAGCLYVKKLADVDQKILEQLITRAVKGQKPGAPPA